jgi:uncharacterized FlaG/YvyC family protein
MRLYELSEGNENKIFYMFTIGEQLNFDRESTINIAQYLKGKYLIEFRALGGAISIIHNGILQAEQLRAKSELLGINYGTLSDKEKESQISPANKGLQEFQSKITEDMWKFFEIKACLIKFKDEEWKITYLQITLSNEEKAIKNILEEERLKLLHEIRPIAELDDIINQIFKHKSLEVCGLRASIQLMTSNWTYDLTHRSASLNSIVLSEIFIKRPKHWPSVAFLSISESLVYFSS